ncbi:MAG: YcnI family protein [Limnohabitans sp.]
MKPCTLLLISGLSLLSLAARAHVTLEYPVATAGQSYKASFRIGHGCGNSPTRVVEVDIPLGVRGAKPMPKPGWSLEVVRETLARPYVRHGQQVTEDTTRIRWTARSEDDMLPSGYYDEFVLVATLPPQAGKLYWPVRQLCPLGRQDWTEVPAAGQTWDDLKSPAAELELMPASGTSAHNH